MKGINFCLCPFVFDGQNTQPPTAEIGHVGTERNVSIVYVQLKSVTFIKVYFLQLPIEISLDFIVVQTQYSSITDLDSYEFVSVFPLHEWRRPPFAVTLKNHMNMATNSVMDD